MQAGFRHRTVQLFHLNASASRLSGFQLNAGWSLWRASRNRIHAALVAGIPRRRVCHIHSPPRLVAEDTLRHRMNSVPRSASIASGEVLAMVAICSTVKAWPITLARCRAFVGVILRGMTKKSRELSEGLAGARVGEPEAEGLEG